MSGARAGQAGTGERGRCTLTIASTVRGFFTHLTYTNNIKHTNNMCMA